MEQETGGVGSTSLSTTVPIAPPVEPEDLTLGKRKASQITTDSEAAPSVTQKRKKRRKVGPEQPTSAGDSPTVASAPPEPQTEQGTTAGNMTRDVMNGTAVVNQPTVSTTKKKRRRKTAGAAQTESTTAEPAELHAEPTTESAHAQGPPPAEPSRTKKMKTVILDLSTVISSPTTTQVRIDLFGLRDQLFM